MNKLVGEGGGLPCQSMADVLACRICNGTQRKWMIGINNRRDYIMREKLK